MRCSTRPVCFLTACLAVALLAAGPSRGEVARGERIALESLAIAAGGSELRGAETGMRLDLTVGEEPAGARLASPNGAVVARLGFQAPPLDNEVPIRPLACTPVCARIDGEDELFVKKVVELREGLTLDLDLRNDGTWLASDPNSNEIGGSWSKKNSRKYKLELDATSLALWLTLLEERAEADGKGPVALDALESPRLTLKLNKKRTKAKLKTRFAVEGERAGVGPREGDYAFKIKGAAS